MSRTKKGNKPPGFEYWGKRPPSMSVPGKDTKQATHQIERAQAKQELLREPTEPEYDPQEYIPEMREYITPELRDDEMLRDELCDAFVSVAAHGKKLEVEELDTSQEENKMTTKEAVEHLIAQFKEDPGYRQTWVANIAVQFQDAFHELHRHQGVHAISNVAAERFMNLLCYTPKEDKDSLDELYDRSSP